ncbi:MAG: prepilin-type N-terminal cleavage/methylation domain-containing protein [Candidatus Omnitrophica bacterium]|nr:prepilin-type N-terminal cleavage/methylation domain-containing protein [Candidatus Omnitrophota bacterium]
MRKNKGFTLLELMIASALVLMIIGGAAAVDFANQQMYVVTNAEMELVQEIDAAVTHINQVVRAGEQVSVDDVTNQISVTTASVTSRHVWDSASQQLWYYPTGAGTPERIANRISGFDITYPAAVNGKVNYFNIKITASGSWGNVLDKQTIVITTIGARPFQKVTVQTG